MALKKACCCLSLRTGTLILLTFLLIASLSVIFSSLTAFGDSMYMYKKFPMDHSYVYYSSFIILLIESLIFLATILSIINNSTSKSLLNIVMAFLLLGLIFKFYMTYLFTRNAIFEIEKNVSEHHKLEIYLNNLGPHYAKRLVHASIVFYFLWMLRSYIAEVRENQAGNAPAQRNIKNGGVNFSVAFPDNVQFAAPQNFNQPPPYASASAPSQWPQQGVNQSVYPNLQQMV